MNKKPCENCRTYGVQFDDALAQTSKTAQSWLESQIRHLVVGHDAEPAEAEQLIKSNLGYMAGYYNDATAKKIFELFNAVHPIFGTATYFNNMKPERVKGKKS